MKKTFLIISMLVVCSMAGTMKDSRDGKNYKTVKIGDQVWMAENLNYKTSESKCYDNKESNCKKYGRLYTWDAAMNACPSGWSLPDNSDFSELKSFVESKVGKGNAGSALKGRTFDMSIEGALEYDDRFGFSGQAAGDRIKNAYKFLGETAYLWSSSEGDDSRAFDWVLSANSDDFFQGNIKFALKKNGFSVRCIKKSADKSETEGKFRDDRANDSNEGSEASSQLSKAQPSSGTLKDSRDGKTYKTVKIGDQVWMAENLNHKTSESECYENEESNCKKYGRLYTWRHAKKVCPSGWHLPSLREFEELINFIDPSFGYNHIHGGASSTAGKHLKSKFGWKSYEYKETGLSALLGIGPERHNGNGTDAFGFSALPAGCCSYEHMGDHAFFWSSTEFGRADASIIMDIWDNSESVNLYNSGKGDTRSVRCLRD